MGQPKWLAEAWQHLSVRERRGPRHNEEIIAFYRDAGHAEVRRDEVPWCAAFVGACLERSEIRSTRSLMARSYLGWGQRIDEPRVGAVTVLSRGPDPTLGHVGFYLGETATDVVLLGGNQSDRVGVDRYSKDRVLGYRWTAEAASDEQSGDHAAGTEDDAGIFETALAHVLEMEGGFTDDPHDPGGPTQKGITLEVYRRFLGASAAHLTRDEIVARLKRIPDSDVREIYRDRYWVPSRAGAMPGPVALIHFDGSVNHGLRGAAELLQAAAGVEIDGEIGPITLGAVAATPPLRLVAAYAERRRARYRALPHFWRFGRGWLNRVSQTVDRARAIAVATPDHNSTSTGTTQKGSDMTTITPAKPWGQSLTIWGALITALSTVVPVFGPALGVDLTPDLVRQAGEQLVVVVQAIGGMIGTLMTIYGRFRANTPLSNPFMDRPN